MQRGAEVVGLDISGQAIEYARSRFPDVSFACAPLSEFTWEGETFDLVSSVTVLQHIPYGEQEKALRCVTRYLKPGGYALLIELVCRPSSRPAEFEGTGSFPNTREGWLGLLRSSGLDVVYERPLLFLPILNGFYLPLKRLVGRALKALGLLPTRPSPGRHLGPDLPPDGLIRRAEARLDYWVLAGTVPLSYLLEYVLVQTPRWGLRVLDGFGSHRLFLARRLEP